jgi:hypothetical protein
MRCFEVAVSISGRLFPHAPQMKPCRLPESARTKCHSKLFLHEMTQSSCLCGHSISGLKKRWSRHKTEERTTRLLQLKRGRSGGTSMTYNQSALLRESRESFQPDTHIYFCPDGAASRRITRSEFSPQKKLAIRNLHALDKRWNLVIFLHYAIWLTTAILAVRSQSLLIDLVLYAIGG